MDAWLPHVFAAVMGLALLLYVILDGYDLGVGLLLPFAHDDGQKNQMIASIGPFWDANETWIVLGVGVLLIAFPQAHGIILTSLYLPATLMLMGLVLRGIAFDFRVKAGDDQKPMWNAVFSIGSLLAASCQGWMLGSYITGLDPSPLNILFSLLAAMALPVLYVMLGPSGLPATGHCDAGDFNRDPHHQRHHCRALVRIAGVHWPGTGAAAQRAVLRLHWHGAVRAGALRTAAVVHGAGADLCAVGTGSGLQPVSGHHHRAHEHPAGRRQYGNAAFYAVGSIVYAAPYPRLHRFRLPHLQRQGPHPLQL
jgi:hypothetical protein